MIKGKSNIEKQSVDNFDFYPWMENNTFSVDSIFKSLSLPIDSSTHFSEAKQQQFAPLYQEEQSIEPQAANHKSQQQMHQIEEFVMYGCRRGKQTSSNNYRDSLTTIAKFKYLQHFLILFRNIKSLSECPVDCKILCFRQGCKPYWQEWLQSGLLFFQYSNNSILSKNGDGPVLQYEQLPMIDHIWQMILFNFVGSILPEDIIGICLNKRSKITLIQFWLRTPTKRNEIGEEIENRVITQIKSLAKNNQSKVASLIEKFKIRYKNHKDSINTQSTMKGAQVILHQPKKLSYPYFNEKMSIKNSLNLTL